ncbi:MAG: preprotein translocase subunit YajC [Clostridia bacterium]|nr:preprotein translocase subunit YajC [Clostridia bacterium]
MNFLLDTAQAGGNLTGTIIMIVVLFLVFWLFMIRPQKKQEQKDNEMRNALAVGDEVTTIGGIIGKVVSIKGETFVLETTRDKTKIRFLKGAIRSVDVKAADIAAAVIAEEQAKAEEANADAPADVAEAAETPENAENN